LPGQTTSASSPATTDSPTWTSAANNAPPPPPPSTGPKTYRVRDGGETMHEIARRTMGNTLAWQEIYRLNPSLNPSATTPIPAGTLLRLPASAKE
jgi:nucleoid-associated protein YgaU